MLQNYSGWWWWWSNPTYLLARLLWSKVSLWVVKKKNTGGKKQLCFFSNALLSSKFSLLDCFWKVNLGFSNIYFLVSRGCRRDTVGIVSASVLEFLQPSASLVSNPILLTFTIVEKKKLSVHWSIHKYLLTIMCGKYSRCKKELRLVVGIIQTTAFPVTVGALIENSQTVTS